jgi:hypothetical protein
VKNIRSILAFIVISSALLIISGCDPPAYTYWEVNRVEVIDHVPFIHVSEKSSWGIGGDVTQPDRYFRSDDFGTTWRELENPQFSIGGAEKEPGRKTIERCSTNIPLVCYRIKGEEKVEVSRDGGSSWQIDWNKSAGRKEFLSHFPSFTRMQQVEPDTIPYDLDLIESDSGLYVIIAMGNQGVLVKDPGGSWSRYAIGNISEPFPAKPLPFAASSLEELIAGVGKEFLILTALSNLLLLLLWIFGLSSLSASSPQTKKTGVPTERMIAIAIIASAIILCVFNIYLLFFFFFVPIIIIFVLIFWRIEHKRLNNAKFDVFAVAGVFSLIFIAAGIIPFVFYATGWIKYYRVAGVFSLIIGIIILVLGFRKENNLVRQSTKIEIVPGEG